MKIPGKALPILVVIIALVSLIAFKKLGLWHEHARELPKSEDFYESAEEVEPGTAPM